MPLGSLGKCTILFISNGMLILGFPGGAVVKNLPTSTGDSRDMGSIPLSGRSPGGGNGNPLQYSCLKNSMDREEEPRWQRNRTGRPLSLLQIHGKNN